ncbi:protein jag [Sandaracinus amylolyticus]|uniref:Jag family protein n=1 Tax=Sandaracinus amylolyticus TaxID=927083 RepID=UPI001F24E1D7|nr:R3H domain-containing nucleic acid-binding protein [Sandaracinus amylolyticus]UJR78997.1 RNA-binding protein Jag [Sandaracinus amylolyticus]
MGDDRKQELEGALLLGDDEELESDSGGTRGTPGDGKAEEAMEFLSGVLYRMGLETRVTVREDDEQVVLDIQGADAGRAIGKKGATLDALQFLANKVVNRFPDGRRYIVVDSGDYRERHDASLVNMARREAKRAVELGRTVTLEPMPARDRRLIHLSLAKFPGVSTKSNGEGIGRRIQIIPARRNGGGGGGGGGGGRRDRDRGPRDDRPRDDRPRRDD